MLSVLTTIKENFVKRKQIPRTASNTKSNWQHLINMKSNELTPNMYSVDKVKGLEVLSVCWSYMTTREMGLGASSWGPANTMWEQDLRILQEAQLWAGATLALGQYLPLLLIEAKANIAGGKELPWSMLMPQMMVNQI